jgi:hypothetical protein
VRRKTAGEPLTFGDVIEADWLYDLYLREGSEPVIAELDGTQKNIARYKPERRLRERNPGKDYTIGFATADGLFEPVPAERQAEGIVVGFGNRRKAIVLTDECETPKLLAKGGRLLVAVLTPWPTNQTEIEDIEKGDTAWRRLGLKPAGDWPGGVVDFSKHVGVWHEAIATGTVAWTVDATDRPELQVAWATYSTRHGPIAALDGISKLIEMHAAKQDESIWGRKRPDLWVEDGVHRLPDRYLEARTPFDDLVKRWWEFEGKLVDDIATVHENRGADLDPLTTRVAAALEGLRVDLDNAIAGLRSATDDGPAPA